MNKKLINDFALALYPIILLFGIWKYGSLMEEAKRTYVIPFVQMCFLEIIFFIVLGLFVYYFLVNNRELHIQVVIVGLVELMVLLCANVFSKVGGNIYAVLSGKNFVFETVFTMYLVLFIKKKIKG